MSIEVLNKKLSEAFPEKIFWEANTDWATLVISADMLYEVVQFLNEDDELQYRFLTDITAVHYPDREGEELCVVYHLHALVPNHRMRIKAYVPIERPHISSLVSLYSSANWMERETYDFFGVIFEGHPNLVRILNVDEMDYFPMRKEYPMEDPTRMDKDDEMFGRGDYM